MTTYTTLVELPADLHAPLMAFLKAHPEWDSDRVMTAALAQFLATEKRTGERSESFRSAARIYLETLFREKLA